jgi:acyl transferase domain-containing protein
MSLRDKVLAPTIKVDEPNPHFDIESSPFYLNTITRPWLKPTGHPRRASFSSFGFGGTNFHVTLEEYTNPQHLAPRQRAFPSELIVMSAEGPNELVQYCETIQEQAVGTVSLSYIAKQTQMDFNPHEACRLAIVAKDCDELVEKIAKALPHLVEKTELNLPNDIYYRHQEFTGKVALLFPGQGSQYLYMGTELLISFGEMMHYWERLMAHRGSLTENLFESIYPKPVFSDEARAAQLAHLTATQTAQPAIAAVSLLYFKLLQQLNIHFDATAGHSFGEIAALYAAGCVNDMQLLDLAFQRGKAYAAADENPGSMLAVQAARETIEQLVAQQSLDVTIANYNSPEQHVLSGDQANLQTLAAQLAQQKISCMPLNVANAFHSNFMQVSQQAFSHFLQDQHFKRFKVPVYSNTTADIYPDNTANIQTYLSEQIVQPVRFAEQIQNMYAAGVRVFIEVGPQNVLTNLVPKILGDQTHTAVAMNKAKQHDIHSLWQALAQLAAVGVPVDFTSIWQEYEEPTAIPKLTAKHILHINGTSYGKPYPLAGGSEDNPKPNPVGTVPSWVRATAATTEDGSDEMANKQQAIIEALTKIEEEVKASHAKYQQTMQQTLQDFMQDIQQQIQQLHKLTEADAPEKPTAPGNVVPLQSRPTPPPPKSTATVAPPPSSAIPKPTAETTQVASAQTSAVSASGSLDPQLQATLLEIVAEKTGYPSEALEMSMDLEADLGIDSIKRVEILSTVQQKMPELPSLDPNELAVLNTLQQIGEYVASKLGNKGASAASASSTTSPPASPTPQQPAPTSQQTAAAPPTQSADATATTTSPTPEAAATPAASGGDFAELEQQLLQIVADKTGYPAEALEMSMDLEADLGIDSIKRVEILSTMQQQVPNLPELDPNDLATLTTLQQIADYVKKKLTS